MVISDLWENKLRTILVVVSIAVGVFAVGMIAGAYIIISDDMSTSYSSGNPANVELWTSSVDEDFLMVIEKLASVKDVEGRRLVRIRLKTGTGEWISMDLLAFPDFGETNVNLLIPQQGEPQPNDRELVIERRSLDQIKASVGDILEVQLSDGTQLYLPFVGTVQDQTTGAADYLATPTGYITRETLEWIHQPRDFNRLLITVSERENEKAHIQQVAAEVKEKLEQAGYQVYMTQLNKTNEHPMTSTLQAVLGVLGALGVLIVFLSSSLITNTLSALLNQHLRQIGVMKLVGGRSLQIFGMYMVLIMSFGMIALIVAIPLGGRAAFALSQMIADNVNFSLQGYRISPLAVVLQVVIALVVPLGAGFIPVLNGSRIKIQTAFSGSEIERQVHKGGRFDELIEKIRWLSRPMLISLRNTFRRKGRLLLTLFTLTLGGAIFIAVFNVQAALEDYVNQIGNYFLADVNLSFDRAYRVDEIKRLTDMVPGVEHIEGWAYASGEILDEHGNVVDNIRILAPPSNSDLIDPMLLAGRWIIPGDENAIVVNEAILEEHPNIRVGDSLRLGINAKEADWTLVGIFKFVGIDTLLGYANYEYLTNILNQPRKAFTYRIVTEEHSLEYQEKMSIQLDRYYRGFGLQVGDIGAGLTSLETASESLDVLITFLIIMAVLTALVGSIGLMGTMGMNVLERTREIGVMRSIGAVDRVIMKSVIVEGLIIGLISWFFGAIISFPISSLFSDIISEAVFNTQMDFRITFHGFLIWLVFVFLLSALASIVPALNAARLTIREVLAYE
jgi:putative ABC transport system permease protein